MSTAINGPSGFSALSQDAIALCSSNPTTPNPVEGTGIDPDANDLFKLDLYYDAPGMTFGSALGQRNGNISQLVWQTRGRQRQGYSLQYDYLDRLTTAYYADINTAAVATADNKFQENITYADKRGNIASMTRNGLYKTTGSATCFTLGQIDNMAYTYNTGTNRLQKIADTAPTGGTGNPQRNAGFNPGSALSTATYAYDANGNMTSDPYKAMTLSYNHLNLPTLFDFGASKTVAILYDHSGKKLRKTVKPNASTTDYTQDYVNGLEYRTTGSGGALTLEAIYHAEGRITPNGANYRYEYDIKDHLGNTRLTFSDLNANNIVDVPGDILQENHYYPFGMNMNYGWLNNTGLIDSRYQYNGKELNEDYGVGLSDYGARWYDATVARWWSVDPMPETAISHSPYHYVHNNPFIFSDPTGMFAVGIGKMDEAYEIGKAQSRAEREEVEKKMEEKKKKEKEQSKNSGSAWPVTRQWQGQDEEGYSNFVDTEIASMQSNNEELDCADLATTLLIRYASQNGLEASFTGVDGKAISSSNTKAKNRSEFESLINTSTNAVSIMNDMEAVSGYPSPGYMTNNGFHVNVVMSPDPNMIYDTKGFIPSTSGSLPARVPWNNAVPIGSSFLRWRVISEAARSKYYEKN